MVALTGIILTCLMLPKYWLEAHELSCLTFVAVAYLQDLITLKSIQ